MDDKVIIAAIAAGAVALGAVLSFSAAWLTARAAARLESSRARVADKRQARAFQRDTLLAVQVELTTYARAVGKMYGHDTKMFRERGSATLFGPELDQEAYGIVVSLGHHVERVVDGGVRAILQEVIKTDHRLLAPTDLKVLEAGMADFMVTLDRAQAALGVALRKYLEE